MRRLVPLVILLGCLSLFWAGWRPGALAPLLTTFHASGAQATGYSINDWVALVPNASTTASLPGLARDMARRAGCESRVRVVAGAGGVKARANCPVPGGELHLMAEAVPGRGRYLVADETVSGTFGDAAANARRVRDVLSPFGRVHESLTLEGILPGLAGPARDRQVLARMLAAGSAREVNGETAREWVSISAYSHGLGRTVLAERHRINLELALVREPGSGKTLVLLGYPLIAITY